MAFFVLALAFELPENFRVEVGGHTPNWTDPACVIAGSRPVWPVDTREINWTDPKCEPGLRISFVKKNTWNRATIASPDNFLLSRKFNCVNFFDIDWLVLKKGFGDSLREDERNLYQLRMIEHWAALSVLFQLVNLNLYFPDGATVYSIKALKEVAEAILQFRSAISEVTYLTPRETIECDGIKPGSKMILYPAKDPGLIMHGRFDFSGHPYLSWVGKQEATFDSSGDNSHLLNIVTARSAITWPFWILKFLGRKPDENVVRKNDAQPMRENEIAWHKILDALPLFNFPGYLFAAEVELIKAGHDLHIDVMRNVFRRKNELLTILK